MFKRNQMIRNCILASLMIKKPIGTIGSFVY